MKLEIHYSSGAWAGLYVDGKLDRTGDNYWVEERVFELTGVEVVHSDAFLRGQYKREGVAQTLVSAYEHEREAALRRAVDLRAKAQAMLEEAKTLDAG